LQPNKSANVIAKRVLLPRFPTRRRVGCVILYLEKKMGNGYIRLAFEFFL